MEQILKNMELKNIAVEHNRLGLFLLVLDLERCQKGLVFSEDNLFMVQKASNGSQIQKDIEQKEKSK